MVKRDMSGFTVGVGQGRVGTRSVRVIFIALLVIVVVLFIPTAQLLQDFPLVALPAPAAVRVLLLPVTCNKGAAKGRTIYFEVWSIFPLPHNPLMMFLF